MVIINKTRDLIKEYSYLIKFNIDGRMRYYYGVRCSNVRLGLKPSEDLFVKYFSSSSSVKHLLKQGYLPEALIVHKQFNSYTDACEFESRFLRRVNARNRRDFINMHDNNNEPFLTCNVGRVLSKEHIDKISKSSKTRQSCELYRQGRRDKMKALWSTLEYRSKMNIINSKFWSSVEGKKLIETRPPTFIGKKHNELTKQKMSEAAKKLGKDKEWTKARALARPRYTCPICNINNLDGGNFNKHMRKSHSWDKTESDSFKKDSRVSLQN